MKFDYYFFITHIHIKNLDIKMSHSDQEIELEEHENNYGSSQATQQLIYEILENSKTRRMKNAALQNLQKHISVLAISRDRKDRGLVEILKNIHRSVMRVRAD